MTCYERHSGRLRINLDHPMYADIAQHTSALHYGTSLAHMSLQDVKQDNSQNQML